MIQTMKVATLFALALGSATAFTSTNVRSTSRVAVSQSAAMDDMVGAVDLRGKEFKFDPVSLLIPIY